MLSKRRASAVESDPESSEFQTSKRARTRNVSDIKANVAPQASGSRAPAAPQSANAPVNVDEEDEEMQQDAPDADDEQKFEEEHEEEIRRKVIGGHKGQGNIAELGIIEKLELFAFMCHKYLVFTFGPQINFIIGHNGSGKSAVLSALTVALGGKATVTGRGSGLKSFIQEGCDSAEVIVTIKNQGEDAYRHKDYGDSIVISRRFNKAGSSSYRIQSKDGRVISTKREELSNICDHMNIQVDNPMNILTQDSARQFLSASQPADKYRFFLRGTQLSQLSEEYSTCMENIVQTQKVLKSKSEVLPDLEDALKDATQRFKEADRARQQKHKADELKKELAWAHVATKEKEYRAKLAEVEKQKKIIKKITSSLEKSQESVKAAEEALQEREQEGDELGQIDHLDNRKQQLQNDQKKLRQELLQYKSDEKSINDEKSRVDRLIKSLEAQIKLEEQKLEDISRGRNEETKRRLDEAIEQCRLKELEITNLKAEGDVLLAKKDEAKTKGQGLGQDIEARKSRIETCAEQLKLISSRERTKLAPFGNNLDHVLADIVKMRWHGQAPVGPFGQFVKVKDPRWAPLLRVRLGSAMGMFVITDSRDRLQLEKLLKHHKNPKPNIVITEVDLFDYSKGEPPEEYTTALRVLQVSNEFVLRVLITSFGIEAILVAESRSHADAELQKLRRGTAWTADSYTVERFPEGGGRSSLAPQLRPGDFRHQLFTGDDLANQKERYLTQMKEAEDELASLNQQFSQYKKTFGDCDRQFEAIKAQVARAEQSLRQLKTARDNLQDEVNQALPVSIQTFRDELKEQEAQLELYLSQFEEVCTKMAKCTVELDATKGPLVEVKAQIANFDEQRSRINAAIEEAATTRVTAQSDERHWQKKLDEEKTKLVGLEDTRVTVEREFEDWTKGAEKYCEQWPNPRSVAEVQRNLESIQKALQDREKRQGATVEQMTAEVNKKKAALENAKRDLKLMMQLNKSLRKSIQVRLARWHEFRRHIALRCKIYFSYHLSNRGYFGKVLFDHINGTLQLKVQTEDQIGTQTGNREKDPTSLSGGEKSFSTICLLLSLWESIGCPIRCLDEFDVFMDAVNRRISMKMMIETANASDRKQYILITPQDMTNVQIGNTVRVHRMTDPERGQAVLAF